jgi:hypothetical protein
MVIYRGVSAIYQVDIDENTVYSSQLQGEEVIKSTFITNEVAPIQEGDYIIWEEKRYTINQAPEIEKLSSTTYKYNVNFEGEIYKLYDKVFQYNGSLEFSFYGTPDQFLGLIITELNKHFPSHDPYWSKGEAAPLPAKLIEFSKVEGYTCRTALTFIAEQFGLEIWINGSEISLVSERGYDLPIVFEYGKGKGLYSLKRNVPEDYKAFNRLWAFGGTQNIPQTYLGGGVKRLRLSGDGYVERDLLPGEKIVEAVYVNEDIYPSFTGTVTALGANTLEFISSEITFNLNLSTILGTGAKVVFQSGALMGVPLEIAKFDFTTKKVTVNAYTDSSGYNLPRESRAIAIGDKFTFVDIELPSEYLDLASNKLLLEATAKLNAGVKLPYTLKVNEKFIRDNGVTLSVGDRVQILDDALGVNSMIRIRSVEYPLVNKGNMTIELSDEVLYTQSERIIIKQIEQERQVEQIDRDRIEKSRLNAIANRKLKDYLIDPDGYFDGTKLRPNSIETLYLTVGAKSQNFMLNGIVVNPNLGGDPNSLGVSIGQLIHHEIGILIGGVMNYIWNITTPYSSSLLNPSLPYYISIRCSKTSNVGTIYVSEIFKAAESDSGYYHFNIGILYPVSNGVRHFAQTHGVTTIVGDQITAGEIKDLSGNNYFDLTYSKFRIGNSNYSLDWNVSNANRLTIRGGLLQNAGGITGITPLDRGSWTNTELYYLGDLVQYNGSSYLCILDTPTAGNMPINATYWKIYAEKGAPGATGATGATGPAGIMGATGQYQGVYNTSTTYYGNNNRRDIVKYDSLYYIANADAGTFSGVVPTDTSKWSPYGANFESIATGLLFAEMAYIENLGVRNLATATSGKRTVLNQDNNSLRFYSGDLADGAIDVEIDDEVYEYDSVGPMPSLGSGVIARGPLVNGVVKAYSSVTSKGIRANGSDLSIGGTTKASIIAFLMKANSIYGAKSLALYAEDFVDTSTTYAAEFKGKTRLNGGVFAPIRFVNTSTVNITYADYSVVTGGSVNTVNLPSSPLDGQIINIRNGSGKNINISSTSQIINDDNTAVYTMAIANKWKGTLQYCELEARWYIIS